MHRRWVRRALPVLVTVVVVAPSAAYANHVFDDVQDGSTHATGMEYVAAKGITKGCDADSYCPDELVTRAQMATFLHRASGNASGIAPSVNADKVDGLDASQLGGGGGGGITGLEIVTGRSDVIGQNAAAAVANCPAGKQLFGGGGSTNKGDWLMTDSRPADTGVGWLARFESDDSAPGDVGVVAYAICVTVG